MWKKIGLLGTMCAGLAMLHPAQASAEDHNHRGAHWYNRNHDRDRNRDYYSDHFRRDSRKNRDWEKRERRREHEWREQRWRDRNHWSKPYGGYYYGPEYVPRSGFYFSWEN